MSPTAQSSALRLVFALALGVLLQLVSLYLILHWVGRLPDGVASRSLIAIAIMAIAMPLTGLVNARLILARAHSAFVLSLLACVAVALLVPGLLAGVLLAL